MPTHFHVAGVLLCPTCYPFISLIYSGEAIKAKLLEAVK